MKVSFHILGQSGSGTGRRRCFAGAHGLARLCSLLVLLMAAGTGSAASAQNRLDRSRNPHGPISIACENCHTQTSWTPIRPNPDFNHNETRYPLRGMHQAVSCRQCHTRLAFTDIGMQCADCHADIHRRQMGSDCERCHTVRGWRVSMQAVKNHSNRFPLLGAHAAVDCEACHKSAAVGQFEGLSTDCATCHRNDFRSAKDPDHVTASFSSNCLACHLSFDSWISARFDHNNLTKFPLTGVHAQLACSACHVGGKFVGTPADCFSCHANDFTSTNNPNHVTAGLPKDCSLCHSTTDWNGAKFDHNTFTKFPLTGAHAQLACNQCHLNNQFSNAPTQCVGCHLVDFNKTTDPNHVSAGFPQDCSVCHNTTSWQGAVFDHNKTAFPLTGAHVNVACAACHVNNVFAGLSTSCASCHLKDFNGTTNPNHVSAGFPQDCTLCHTTTTWQSAVFDHSKTQFPLTGAHVNVACSQCHTNNVFAGTPTQCVACHLKDFNGTTNPNHVSAGFPQDCTLCHTTASWQGAVFDHSKTTFPLTGAHVNVACAQCHVNNQFTGLPTQCVGCHLQDFNGTTSPNHVAAGFPQDCTLCHNTTAWQGAVFDHSKTGFVLTGAHASLQCAACHANNRFAGTPTACASCHLTDFNGTTNPNHAAAGFPQDCSLCHTTTSWAGATFNHNNTPFPLTGAHVNVACASCHINNVFAGLSTACVSCHLQDFNGTTNPNHAAAGFPQDCSICHTTTSWAGATFNHNNTPFPLTGAHVNVACTSCHINSVFAGTPTDCYSCHSADYNGTTNPNHKAAGFPTTCATCHTTTAWTGATFNHTYFPLNHGNANGVCATCHTNPSDYSVFTCTNCHTQSQTDPEHRGVSGYVYNSANCYQCHRNGRGG